MKEKHASYRHLFGPVPSRRLGMSLGVDLVPHKTCTFDCIYCECGRTTNLTRERKEYVPEREIFEELGSYFERQPDPETITFSGAGEPTLHSGLGRISRWIKEKRPGVPLAMITNGSLLTDPQVRKDLDHADLVLPSLDAAVPSSFQWINRPEDSFTLDEYIGGLEEFRNGFKGKIWLEVMILPGINDGEDNLLALKHAFMRIRPDRVQINTLDRPGRDRYLKPATPEKLESVAALWNMDCVDIIASGASKHSEKRTDRSSPSSGHRGRVYKGRTSSVETEQVVVETISRRPCTVQDLEQMLEIPPEEIRKILHGLEARNEIIREKQERGTFYRLKRASSQ